jgi:predicted transcriptional regulator
MSDDNELVHLTADIVSAHVANNNVACGEVGALISAVYGALSGLGAEPVAEEAAKPQRATTARKSVANTAHIVSMIDGKPYKMLRRHIGQHGYTPESYCETFGLPRDYPMVAKDYAETRRALAHKIGLGRKPGATKAVSAAKAAIAAKPAGAAKPATPKTAAAATAPAKPTRRKLKPSFSEALAQSKDHLGGE